MHPEEMYLVQLVGDTRTFFTDGDPSIPTHDLFNEVEVAYFEDSYTPRSGVKERRRQDAQDALEEGNSRPARINYKAVAKSERVL